MRNSIRFQLALWMIPALIVLLSIGAVSSYIVARRAVDLAYDHALVSEAADLARNVSGDAASLKFELSAEAEEEFRTDNEDHLYFAVYGAGGNFIEGDRDLPLVPATSIETVASKSATMRGYPVQILAIEFHEGNKSFVVAVAETTNRRTEIIWSILATMLIGELMVVALTGLVVWKGIHRGLRPLHALQGEVSIRTADDLSPIDVSRVPLEARSIIVALNDLLARLEQSYTAQKRFVADAAHQLRTPLASVLAQAELLNKTVPPAWVGHTDLLRKSVERMVRLTNQLLSLARVEPNASRPMTTRRTDLSELVRGQLQDWVRRAIEQEIDLGFELQSAIAEVDSFLVQELMNNLVDNALHHTPRGGTITVASGEEGKVSWLAVDDNGPGIPEAYRQKVFERFFRAPGSAGDGTGLGLSIVSAIAQAHKANIIVEQSKLGGTRICVHFDRVA